MVGGGGGLGSAVARALAREGAHVAVAGRDQGSAGRTVEAIAADGGEAVRRPSRPDRSRVARCGARSRSAPAPARSRSSSTTAAAPADDGRGPAGRALARAVRGDGDRRDRADGSRAAVDAGARVGDGSSPTRARASSRRIPNLALSNALRLVARRLVEDARRRGGGRRRHRQRRRPRPDRHRSRPRARRGAGEARGHDGGGRRRLAIASIPAGRYGDPEEYAAAVAFLAGEPASYITGAMLRVDGGQIRSL